LCVCVIQPIVCPRLTKDQSVRQCPCAKGTRSRGTHTSTPTSLTDVHMAFIARLCHHPCLPFDHTPRLSAPPSLQKKKKKKSCKKVRRPTPPYTTTTLWPSRTHHMPTHPHPHAHALLCSTCVRGVRCSLITCVWLTRHTPFDFCLLFAFSCHTHCARCVRRPLDCSVGPAHIASQYPRTPCHEHRTASSHTR
jgi:hypothetical protein